MVRNLYVAYVRSDYKNGTHDFYDIELRFDYQPSISMIRDQIREHTNFWDCGITLVSIIDIDKI